MGLVDDALARQASAPPPRRIDWERMNKVMPRQKAELTRARNAVEKASEGLSYWERYDNPAVQQAVEKLAQVIKRHIAVWNEIGAWPDSWHTWNIALNDALPLGQQIDISDL